MVGLRTANGWLVVAIAAGALALAASTAEAKRKPKKPDEPLPALTFVGSWAKDAEACKAQAGTDKAPVVFSEKSYKQFETNCRLSALRNAGEIWTANAECTVQGDKQRHSIMLHLTGDEMDLGWDAPGGMKLVRCK